MLAAKKQAEAAMRKASQRSPSRSRSRHRERAERDRRKGGGSASAPPSSRKVDKELQQEALMKKIVKVREVGEGWFAAVSAASSAWDSVPEGRRPSGAKASQEGGAVASEKRKTEDRRKPEIDTKERERFAREEKARIAEQLAEEQDRRTEQTREQERLEKTWAVEAEAREKRRLEEKKKMEDDRKAKQNQEKQRRQKLGNAFAVDGDEDDEDDKRKKKESDLLRKASEKRRANVEATSAQQGGAVAALPLGPKGDKDLADRLGFDGALDPAEAFIRLQERKRKGRRTEFGGPPRGCSPWRDGKRGVITPIAQSRIDREK